MKKRRVVVPIAPRLHSWRPEVAASLCRLQTAIDSGTMHEVVRVRACNVGVSHEQMVRAQMRVAYLQWAVSPMDGDILAESPMTAWLLVHRTNWRTICSDLEHITRTAARMRIGRRWTEACLDAVRARHRDLIAVEDCLVA